jgi:TPP-dependent pyruvate/acetoin dehydrogenase alpha subunit
LTRRRLLSKGVPSDELDRIVQEAQAQVADAVEFSESSPWPDEAEVASDLFTEEAAQ